MTYHNLPGIQREFANTPPRFVIAVLRSSHDCDAVPTFITGREGVSLFEGRRLERAGGEFRPGKTARKNNKLAVPFVGQRQLEFRIVGNDAVDVTMWNGRRDLDIHIRRGPD